MNMLKENLYFLTIEEAEQEIQSLQKKCMELEEGLKRTEKAYYQCNEEITGLEGEKKKTKQLLEAFEDQKRKLEEKQNQVLKEQEFFSLENYQRALLKEEELEQLQHEINDRKTKISGIKDRIFYLEKETAGKKRKNLEQIKDEIEKNQAEKREYDEKLQQISHYLDSNQQIQKKVLERKKEQKSLREQYLIIKTLSETANGELSGKEKIKFEQYVQGFYFRKVIQEANKRFRNMSNGQFELRYMETAFDKRSKSGLGLEVMDYYTGTVRAVTSLSGGESFQAALSLALGLSDVIQNYAGGIQVDAMFIDEGFGTLDENALEQAVETLANLAGTERMVGIISHVSELKERIEQKIFVHKSPKGSKIEMEG